MGRKNLRSNRSSETDNGKESSDSEDGLRSKRPPKSAEKKGSAGPNTSGATGLREAERYYGTDFDSIDEVRALQHKEQSFGSAVFRWLDEGIPTEAMGNIKKMEAYRERKGTPVPWDAEKRNTKSARRSRINARDTGPAGETGVPDSVRQVVSSPGQSLDADVQRTMEDKMGDSFSDVQIHTGPQAAKACEDINAKAFTVGNNIAFNKGEYDPSSKEGQHVLAHELAHVRQQTGGAVSMLPQNDVAMEIDPDPKLEEEAEKTAQRVMEGGKLDIQRMADTKIHVHRVPELVAQRDAERSIGFRAEDETEQSEESFATAGPALVQRLQEKHVVQRARKYDKYIEKIKQRGSPSEEIDEVPEGTFKHPGEVTEGDDIPELGVIDEKRDATKDGVHQDVFEAAFPEFYGFDEDPIAQVHHAIEQQIIDPNGTPFFPGLISPEEIHSIENLRGIPKDRESEIHQSILRVEWNDIYRERKFQQYQNDWIDMYKKHIDPNPSELTATEAAAKIDAGDPPDELLKLRSEIRSYILQKVKELDKEFGRHFLPEMYTDGETTDE
jgi:hypothetical protein